jgi:hypothetical protein
VHSGGVILTRRPAQVPDGHLEAGTTEDHDAADGSEGLVRRSEKSGWPLIFFFLNRLRFRTRSVRNLSRLFRLAMSCQLPATLGNGAVYDHIVWASTRHLRSLALLPASASWTGARERPSAAKLRPLVAGASGRTKMISGG